MLAIEITDKHLDKGDGFFFARNDQRIAPLIDAHRQLVEERLPRGSTGLGAPVRARDVAELRTFAEELVDDRAHAIGRGAVEREHPNHNSLTDWQPVHHRGQLSNTLYVGFR